DDEDVFVEEELAPQVADQQAAVSARAAAVRAALQRSDTFTAVTTALQAPPVGKDVQALKDANTQTVLEALMAVRQADMGAIVAKLPQEQVDVLMKYIYRGMASPEVYNAATLLAWHEKTVEVGGLGCVSRVLTDRNTV
ncbi:hypothetical protein CXG81DRAFT_7785, partial [Caulochytrium protostelioides]